MRPRRLGRMITWVVILFLYSLHGVDGPPNATSPAGQTLTGTQAVFPEATAEAAQDEGQQPESTSAAKPVVTKREAPATKQIASADAAPAPVVLPVKVTEPSVAPLAPADSTVLTSALITLSTVAPATPAAQKIAEAPQATAATSSAPVAGADLASAAPATTASAAPLASPSPAPSPTPVAAPLLALAAAAPPMPAKVADVISPQAAAAKAAVAWAEAELHSPDPSWSNQLKAPWSGYCEAFVEIAYGTRHHFGSAAANYAAQRAAGRIQSDLNPPAGALVFYANAPYGHVALSLGNGQVITTWGYAGQRFAVRKVPLQAFSGAYLGWAPAPDNWLKP